MKNAKRNQALRDDLREVINEIFAVIEKEKDMLVIAEGKKDYEALKKLGFEKILALKGKPLYEIAEQVSEKRVLVLTDLDAEGKKIYAAITGQLRTRGIHVDDTLRNLLFKTELRHIEGLFNYLKKALTKEAQFSS
jgi:5S rRNA maturation endonuclease (ribonuclease M5)